MSADVPFIILDKIKYGKFFQHCHLYGFCNFTFSDAFAFNKSFCDSNSNTKRKSISDHFTNSSASRSGQWFIQL